MRILLTFLLCCGSFGLLAQIGGVRGNILTSDCAPAEFINVIVKGTSKGAVTNDKGIFEIKNFQWFSESLYKVTGGGKILEYTEPLSETFHSSNAAEIPALDRAWEKMKALYPTAEIIEVHSPETMASPIAANASPDAGTYWQTVYRYFDQYTLEELSVDHIFGRINDANTADVIRRMNYDIHVGAILGLPGKILAFFASLIAASLPITGFYIWWGRRNKKKKKKKVNPTTSKASGSKSNRSKVSHPIAFSNDLASPVCYADSDEVRDEFKD